MENNSVNNIAMCIFLCTSVTANEDLITNICRTFGPRNILDIFWTIFFLAVDLGFDRF